MVLDFTTERKEKLILSGDILAELKSDEEVKTVLDNRLSLFRSFY